MQIFTLKKSLYKLLNPFDKSDGPPLYIQAHHGPFKQWYNSEHIPKLESMGLRRDDWVLDYGCGAGRMAEQLFAWGVKQYCGYDCNKKVIQYARRFLGYPGYTYNLTEATSELYGTDLAPFHIFPAHPTIAIMLSVITHMMPGEMVPVFETLYKCKTIRSILASCFIVSSKSEGKICGTSVQLSKGTWVMRKDNPCAIVAYEPVFLSKLAPDWKTEFQLGHWRTKTVTECRKLGVHYQDFAILSRV